MRIDIKGVIVSNDWKDVYDWYGIEATCPKDVISKLEDNNGETADIYINSGGGEIFAGSEIYEALRSYKGKVKIHVVGQAASAASVIACAGESDISPTAMIMVHNVSAAAEGDYHQMDKTSKVLKTANQAIAAAYVSKSGMSEAEALSMMEAETWLTAAQAVEKGLIDTISEPQAVQLAAARCPLLPMAVLAKTKNMLKDTIYSQSYSLVRKNTAQAKLNYLKMKGGI